MIDFARLIRALTGEPEPVKIKTVTLEAEASLENLRAMIARLGRGLTDEQQCALWYRIETLAFEELGEVAINTWPAAAAEITLCLETSYPQISFKLPDSEYSLTNLAGLTRILKRDWTNLVPYVIHKSDCDKYGNRLYEHCCRYYGVNTLFPVWGLTDSGASHGWNLAVIHTAGGPEAILVEPQTDAIGAAYFPQEVVIALGEITI